MSDKNTIKKYDCIVCGGGPAGVTAAIYAARGGLSVAVIEKEFVGGQAAKTYEIENYPGFLHIEGSEFSLKLEEQAKALGVVFLFENIMSFNFDDEIKIVNSELSGKLEAKSVVLAFGAKPRLLDVEGEEKFTGRGVSYCATCDGAFYKGKEVVVVGGGNTAVEDAIYLTRFAKKVSILHRRDEFRAGQFLVEKLKSSNVNLLLNTIVTKIEGNKKIEKISVKDIKNGKTSEFNCDGIFVAVGQIPQTEILSGKIALDREGYILSDEYLKTNIEGVFCAGDIRVKHLRQIVTACADGAIAGEGAIAFVNNIRKP